MLKCVFYKNGGSFSGFRISGHAGYETENGELRGIALKNETSGETSELSCDGMFVAIGLIPENEPFRNLAELDSFGYLDSDERCLTKTPGVFVAGDCRTKSVRQLTTATADGSVAALAACKYIDNN